MSTKNQLKNAEAKMKFFEYLQGAKGFTESSINAFGEAVYQWEKFVECEDFANFNRTKALSFVEHLKERESKTESGHLGLQTQYNYLRRVKKFFDWLADQPGYRSQINKNEVAFLRLSKKEVNIATSGTTKKIPTYEEVRKIIENINIENEIDMRDRALICLALTTGMRISALISLRMKSFNKERELFDQNPGDGVRTKNDKRIFTTFFPIAWKEPREYFLQWFEYLEKKGFQSEDPIFPATKRGQFDSAHNSEIVSVAFWKESNAAREVFKRRCLDAKVSYYHPHLFRHLIVELMSKTRLTEEEKRAISLNLGHANVGTTFGSYGYGSMSPKKAVEVVRNVNLQKGDDHLLRNQLMKFLEDTA